MSSPSGSSWYSESGNGSSSSSSTTPEPQQQQQQQQQQGRGVGHQQHHHALHHHHSKILAQTHPNHKQQQQQQQPVHGSPRRSSTPAQAFLAPRLFGHHAFYPPAFSEHTSGGAGGFQPGSSPTRTSNGGGFMPGSSPTMSSASSTTSSGFVQHNNSDGVDSSALATGNDAASTTPHPIGARRTNSFGSALGNRLGALSALRGTTSTPAVPQAPQPPQPASTSTPASPAISAAKAAPAPPAPAPAPQQYERRHICVPDGCGGFITVEDHKGRGSAPPSRRGTFSSGVA